MAIFRTSLYRLLAVVLTLPGLHGCQTPPSRSTSTLLTTQAPARAVATTAVERKLGPEQTSAPILHLATYQQSEAVGEQRLDSVSATEETIAEPLPGEQLALDQLETLALHHNPTLRRLRHEAAAEWARSRYVGALPDPSISSMVFTPPMHFEPDRQRAEFQVMQMIPWLDRLQTESQRAHLEAAAAENMYRAERLRVIGDLRVAWSRLYVLAKEIETTQTDQVQLESLISTANARVATGNASPGDVLLANLELSELQEQLISYRQQLASVKAEMNKLVGRQSQTPIAVPTMLEPELPQWSHELLRKVALELQPELNAARLRTAATRLGIQVARLRRRPDLTFGAGWMVMDAPGAISHDAGRDSFTLGVTATLPVWRRKYDAITTEACSDHAAAHASESEVAFELEAKLHELWEQARAAQETAELYQSSILPQARQAFEADQQALVNNTVTFERLVNAYRKLLNLELGYHRTLGQLATTLARIRQLVGTDLAATLDSGTPL